jgi:hypothetical protein
LLRRFAIKPGTIRVGDATPKGYLLADLTDAFGRYLPNAAATPATTSNSLDNLAEFDPPHRTSADPVENGRNRLDFADVADVAAPAPEREPGCDDEVPF